MSSVNQVFKFGVTALAALVLSACGGSSGGSGSSNNSVATPANNQAQQNQPTTPANNQVQQKQANTPTNNNVAQPSQQVNNNGTGATLVISGDDHNASVRRSAINGYNTTNINVDGTNVTIGYPGISAGGWSKIKANGRDLQVCCGRYSDIRFGVSDSSNDRDNTYLFYNGNPTNNMPTSGTASYVGQSIITADITTDIPALDDEDYYTGTSQFNVDFGNKTLNGSLGINKIQPVNINASISGNSFNGTANSSSLPSAARVEGKFYGEQAKQLAGLAQANDNSWAAAFGAQKQ